MLKDLLQFVGVLVLSLGTGVLLVSLSLLVIRSTIRELIRAYFEAKGQYEDRRFRPPN